VLVRDAIAAVAVARLPNAAPCWIVLVFVTAAAAVVVLWLEAVGASRRAMAVPMPTAVVRASGRIMERSRWARDDEWTQRPLALHGCTV
jgi:hypothetical protein